MGLLRIAFFFLVGIITLSAQSGYDRWMLSGRTAVDRAGLGRGEVRQLQIFLAPEAAYFPRRSLGFGLRSELSFIQSSAAPNSISTDRFWRTHVALAPFFRLYWYDPPGSDIRIFLEGSAGYAWGRAGTELERFEPVQGADWSGRIGFGWSPAAGWALESSLGFHSYEKGPELDTPSGRRLIRLGTAFRLFLNENTGAFSPPRLERGAWWLGGGVTLEQSFDGFQQVSLAPSVGYLIYEAFLLGGHLNLDRGVREDLERFNWSFEPFGRYYFSLNDRWHIFPHIAGAYQSNWERSATAGQSNIQNFVWRFGTGINGFLTPTASVEILTQYSISNLDLDNNFSLLSGQERRLGIRATLRYWLIR